MSGPAVPVGIQDTEMRDQDVSNAGEAAWIVPIAARGVAVRPEAGGRVVADDEAEPTVPVEV